MWAWLRTRVRVASTIFGMVTGARIQTIRCFALVRSFRSAICGPIPRGGRTPATLIRQSLLHAPRNGIGLPLGALVQAARHRKGDASARERISLLVDSYHPRFWACESTVLFYKFVMTGAVLVLPDARLQVWLGAVTNVAACLTFIQCVPFKSTLCNAVASTALLQLLLTYITAFLFLGNNDELRTDLSGWVGTFLVLLNCTCFVVLAIGATVSICRTQMSRKVPSFALPN